MFFSSFLVKLHVSISAVPPVEEGSNVNVTCYVSGKETVRDFTWYRDGVVFPSVTSHNYYSYITILNITRNHNSIYNCSATSLAGAQSNIATGKVHVVCKYVSKY